MISLHNAVVPFDGDEIVVDPKEIESITIDHSQINSDCTRIVMKSGTVYQVEEDIKDIKDMILGESNG